MQVEEDKDKNEQEREGVFFFFTKNLNKNVLDWVSCQLAADIKPNLISLDGTGRQYSAVPQLGES